MATECERLQASIEKQLDEIIRLRTELAASVRGNATTLLAFALERLHRERCCKGPVGQIALVMTEVEGSAVAWRSAPVAMHEAMQLHDKILRRHAAACSGFEFCSSPEGSFLFAFPDARKALQWCSSVQRALVTAEWNDAILEVPQCKLVTAGETDRRVLFAGPRIKIGVDLGHGGAETDPTTGRTRYTNQALIRRVAAICQDCARGGEIVLGLSAYAELEVHGALAGLAVKRIDRRVLLTKGKWEDFWLVTPFELTNRHPPVSFSRPLSDVIEVREWWSIEESLLREQALRAQLAGSEVELARVQRQNKNLQSEIDEMRATFLAYNKQQEKKKALLEEEISARERSTPGSAVLSVPAQLQFCREQLLSVRPREEIFAQLQQCVAELHAKNSLIELLTAELAACKEALAQTKAQLLQKCSTNDLEVELTTRLFQVKPAEPKRDSNSDDTKEPEQAVITTSRARRGALVPKEKKKAGGSFVAADVPAIAANVPIENSAANVLTGLPAYSRRTGAVDSLTLLLRKSLNSSTLQQELEAELFEDTAAIANSESRPATARSATDDQNTPKTDSANRKPSTFPRRRRLRHGKATPTQKTQENETEGPPRLPAWAASAREQRPPTTRVPDLAASLRTSTIIPSEVDPRRMRSGAYQPDSARPATPMRKYRSALQEKNSQTWDEIMVLAGS
eukprot:TRINITY_DN69197_c0_g1_i1.p1 TRINITY_DN69197_c0_g1~~TRINITY_DN69197_c0_g1_i1.p1  ORF type:complete len:684 (+),score=98.54 TRINITY_DN69197_c0_g1_i1:33-2084(+)